MTAITIDTHLIPYEMKGQGTPLLFISGMGTNYTIWNPLSETFTSEHAVIAANPQNFYTLNIEENDLYLKSLADSFLKFTSELQIESPTLIGHSSGAAIASAIAYYYPDKVHKLILINPFRKIDYVRLVFLTTLEKLMQRSLNREEAIELLIPWLFSRVFLSNTENVNQFIAASKDYFGLNNIEDLKNLINFLPKIDISPLLTKIKNPTLILAGDQDIFISNEDRAAFVEAIPNGELMTIPSTGHMAHWEQPEYCSKMIKKFLTE